MKQTSWDMENQRAFHSIPTDRDVAASEKSIVEIIHQRQLRFAAMVRAAQRATSFKIKAQRCQQAAMYAANNPCGILCSADLERELILIASTLRDSAPAHVNAKQFLHVFTRIYASGGHTRVAERWIQASPSDQRHDFVLISQGTRPVPPLLLDACAQKHGKLIHLSGDFPIEKAQALRTLAESYEAIILHVHPYDVVPMIAFGINGFSRPIIYYNHADHLFWLGSSIADLLVNFRSGLREMNRSARYCSAQYVLPLPLLEVPAVAKEPMNAAELKKSLGFEADSKVMVTVASAYKYTPMDGLDFIATAKEILARNQKAVLVAIGPSESDMRWKNAREQTGGRIRAIGVIPAHALDAYLSIADLALESFPLNSPTALLEIAKHGVPCLALETAVKSIDAFEEAGILCPDVASLIEKAGLFLNSENRYPSLLTILQRDCLPEGFGRKLSALYDAFPKVHVKRTLPEDAERPPITPFEYFIAQQNIARHRFMAHRVRCGVQRIIDDYVMYAYPLGMPRWIYRWLNSYGVI